MPRATNNIQDVTRVDLKTCEGGYVVLRRMTYGQWLKRQEIAMSLAMKQANPGNGQDAQDMIVDVGIKGADVAHFEFGVCIAEHNLEDEQGQPLNFQQPFTVDILDPRIGQEIGAEIDKLNQIEAALGN